MYGAFPIASVFMKKGVKFSIIRLIVDIFGIIIISYIVTGFVKEKELEKTYKNSESI